MLAQQLLPALPIIFAFLFGIIYCFYGYRFLKFQLIFAGCFLGFNVGFLFAGSVFPGEIGPSLIGGFFGFIIGAVVFTLVYQLAVFCIGFSAGTLLAPAILSLFPADRYPPVLYTLVLVGGLICGILAVKLQRQFLIIFTSTVGSFFTVMALILILNKKFQITPGDIRFAYHDSLTDCWWLILGLVISGIICQLRTKDVKGKS